MTTPHLQVEVVSREGRFWHGKALHVKVPTVDGSVGILPNRQPLLAALGSGEVVVDTPEAERQVFSIVSGFVSVDSSYVTVVAEHASVVSS